jgi:hypothetical protein
VRYDWLADFFLTVHFGYLAFLVVGGFLAWRWPKAFFVHLGAAIWAVLIVLSWVDCPLTWAENWARQKAGLARIPGFIDNYVTGVIYPAAYVNQVRLAVLVVVLVSWVGALVLRRRRRSQALAAAPHAETAGPTG